MDDILESRAEGIANSIDTYWKAERQEAPKDDFAVESLTKIDNVNFAKITERWVEEKNQAILNFLIS